MDPKLTFTLKEIAVATGMDLSKLQGRYKARIRTGEIPEGLQEFNYTQVKLLLTTRAKNAPDPRKVDVLKCALIDDGFGKKG